MSEDKPTAQDDWGNRIADLSPAKRALLELKLKQKKAAENNAIQVQAATTAPLSFAQQRLWFLEQLEPGSPAYNIPSTFVLQGPLDVPGLSRSLNSIVERHASLRTIFTVVDEEPLQMIQSTAVVTLDEVDLQGKTAQETDALVQEYSLAEAQRPFDLSVAPMLRARLLRLAPEKHLLLLTMHHIASDGWSWQILLRELAEFYNAIVSGIEPTLPPLPIQYIDFAIWQRRHLSGARLQRQLAYWQRQLAGAPPLLELPTDRPRPAVQSYRGRRLPVQLPVTTISALKELSKHQNASLFMTLFAAFNILLYRYTRQADIVVGSPIANRNRAEIEGLIGFFVNTLVLRTDMSGDPTFVDLLSRVKETALAAYDHQDLPYEKLVEEIQPERTLSYNPVFQVMFVLHNIAGGTAELKSLSLETLDSDNATSKFDLTLSIIEESHQISGYIEYNTDLFDLPTITRLWDHFQILLAGIIADPARPIAQLPLMTAQELEQIIFEWNKTAVPYPQDLCIHNRFEQQAATTPEAPAAIFADEVLSYADLNRRANQLAHGLQERGVGPDVRVAICIERSREMLIGLLGILKAGGAYVPVDPTYPPDRLAYMLDDSQAAIILTQESLLHILPSPREKTICLDAEWDNIAATSVSNPERHVTLDHLLYMIYTSGSTGRPKGVALPHRALSNLINWQLDHSNLPSGARTLQFTTLSFDVSCQEIFSTWSAGGTLVMINESLRQDSERLAQFIADKRVERLFLPFIALQQLAEAIVAKPELTLALEEVVTAGEQLQITPAIRELFSRLTSCRLFNQYGPSETHVATAYGLSAEANGWQPLPPIGRPIANTNIYLVDELMQIVPIGVPGELLIGGHNVARGYHNQPALTAERFINNPFLHNCTDRLYRTGDLARFLPDGNIVFMGRIDQQVKIRGYRIEPGEIETVMSSHPAVHKAVVTIQTDAENNRRLIAFYEVSAASTVTATELRTYLRRMLPEYMVPSLFIVLDKLPETPSGKIDRRALPEPDPAIRQLDSEFVAPSTAVESIVAGVWQEILKLDRIGVQDNFFDLGGHSLLATQVISRLRNSFKTALPLRALFESPTISGLAHEIVSREGQPGQAEKIARVLQKLGGLSPTQVKHLLKSKQKGQKINRDG